MPTREECTCSSLGSLKMSLQLRVLAPQGGRGSGRDCVGDGGDGGLHIGCGEEAALGHPRRQDGVEGA